jgi:hypothetical protein
MIYAKLIIAAILMSAIAGVGAVVMGWKHDAESVPVLKQEVTDEKANTKRLAGMYATQQKESKRYRKLAHDRAIVRETVTAALALNLNSKLPDFDAVNAGVCKQLERIQGSPVEGCMSSSTEAGQTGGRHYTPFATIDKQSVLNFESALSQCADYIELSERPAGGNN